MIRGALIEALRRPGAWLLIAANAVPVLGAIWLGWDASTLVVLYWMETAIVGFWLLVRLSYASPRQLGAATRFAAGPGITVNGPALAVFVLAHASIFMLVHFFFLTFMLPGEWNQHLGSVQEFVSGFVIPSGIWLPLAGLFLVRGVIAISEIRSEAPATNVVFGFYLRIVIMQLTILFSGFLALAIGGTAMLVLLVVLKTLADLVLDALAGMAIRTLDKPAA
jgi:hypothetical protein